MTSYAQKQCVALLLLSSCTVDPIIGGRDDAASENDADTSGDGASSDGAPGDGEDGTPGDGADGTPGDGSPADGDPGNELPSCDGGFLSGEGSCRVCCVVDGDILDWCEDVPCTACEEDGLQIEPGATKHETCNTCTCGQDGTISCTDEVCDVDCDATPDACSWRTDNARGVHYRRSDGSLIGYSDLDGYWAHTPSGDLYLDQAQVGELLTLLAAPALRDFARNGTGDCPAIDGYWSQLRSERPPVEVGGHFTLWLSSQAPNSARREYVRELSPDCEVSALAPLGAFLDRLSP